LATKFKSPDSLRAFSYPPAMPVLAWLGGLASRASSLPFPRFWPLTASLFSVFIWWSRERARGYFQYWCGFQGGRLYLASRVAGATENKQTQENRPRAVAGVGLAAITREARAPGSGHSSRWARAGASPVPARCRERPPSVR